MKSLLFISLFVCFLAITQAENYTATTNFTLDSTNHNVTVNVFCSNSSNFSYMAAWLGNNQKDVNVSVIKSFVNSTVPVNFTDSFIYAVSANNNTNFTFSLSSQNLQNIGDNYTYVVYCQDSNQITTPAVYNKWQQPDNNGRNFKLSVVYNGTLNVSQIAKAQAQAVWEAIVDLVPTQVVDENGESAVRNETRILTENVSNETNTTVVTYVLKYPQYYNDSSIDYILLAFSNATKLADDIQAGMNKSGLGNFTVLNVSYVTLPVPTLNLTSSNQTNSTINLTISSQTLTGAYYLVGTWDQTYDPLYLSKENIVAGQNEHGQAFNITASGNLTNGSAQFQLSNLTANTTVRFFSVIKEDIPRATPSNIAYNVFSTLANNNGSSNTSNATNFTATVTVTVSNTSYVNILVNCSQASTTAMYGADLGNHNPVYTAAQIITFLDNKSFYSNAGESVYGISASAAANLFYFTISPNDLRNIGNNYSVVAYCQNTSQNYSEKGLGRWKSPDNNGKDFIITVTYNGSLNATANALHQAQGLASLLPNVSSNLIVTPDGTPATNTTNQTLLARMLADTTNTTIVTYVLRNYSLASDNTSAYINSLNQNSSTTVASLQNYYTNHSVNLSALSFVSSSLLFPSLSLSFVGSSDTQATVQIGANVDGDYSVCAVNGSFDPSYLEPSDVMTCVDQNVNTFPAKSQDTILANTNRTITFRNLKSNSTYQFLGVLRNNLPKIAQQISTISRVEGNTQASTFGEKLISCVIPLIALVVAVLLN